VHPFTDKLSAENLANIPKTELIARLKFVYSAHLLNSCDPIEREKVFEKIEANHPGWIAKNTKGVRGARVLAPDEKNNNLSAQLIVGFGASDDLSRRLTDFGTALTIGWI
jgi:hypothetical protein